MTYDVAIVGGGIIGAGVARDAALRGLDVALLEKEDYASGTTSRSTRLIHGGLRYLAQYDFGLVHEALRERRLLLRNAPHLVRPLPFLLPVYRGHGHAMPILWSGMMIYDYLRPRRGVPHHKFLPPGLCLRLEPALRPQGLRGGFLYYDAQCAYPERLCLENVLDAADEGAVTRNHARVVALERTSNRVKGVRVKDELAGTEETLEARLVLNCAGPWLDDVERLAIPGTHPKLRRTKGIHLVVPRFNQHALIFESQDLDRVVFAIPWGQHTLVGTTDTDYRGENEEVRADREDVDYLLDEIGNVTRQRLTRQDILFTTAGLRPLMRQVGRTTAEITRRHVIVDHERASGLSGYATIVGGKITTFRAIAEEIVDFAVRKLRRRSAACRTRGTPLPGGRIRGPWPTFVEDVVAQARRVELEADVAQHLADTYGAQALQVLKFARDRPDLGKRLRHEGPWIWAQVEHAARGEQARTLADVLLRRLMIGLGEGQARREAPAVAQLLAAPLGWSAKDVVRQVEDYESTLKRNWPASV